MSEAIWWILQPYIAAISFTNLRHTKRTMNRTIKKECFKIEGSAAKPFTSELTERKRVTRNVDSHSHIAEHHRLT